MKDKKHATKSQAGAAGGRISRVKTAGLEKITHKYRKGKMIVAGTSAGLASQSPSIAITGMYVCCVCVKHCNYISPIRSLSLV
jgi:cyanophycinase-like exopeptidase